MLVVGSSQQADGKIGVDLRKSSDLETETQWASSVWMREGAGGRAVRSRDSRMEPQHSEGGQGERDIQISFRGTFVGWLQRSLRNWSAGGHLQNSVGAVSTPCCRWKRGHHKFKSEWEVWSKKQSLLDRAEKETDLSNLRRRQVQGKVYVRWGEPWTCCQLWEKRQGRRLEAQERGEMINERRWETWNGGQRQKG